jgi:hypothetical protein
MKTSTLEKPVAAEIHNLSEKISTEFLKLVHEFVPLHAEFDNNQGLTIRDDVFLLREQPLPKEIRNKLIEAGIVVDNSMYLANGKDYIIVDNLMYLTAGVAEDNAMFLSSIVIRDDIMLSTVRDPKKAIIEDNYIYLYKKPDTNPMQEGNSRYIVVTGAVARMMENAKAGVIIRDDVMYRKGPQGTMVAMPVHHFGSSKNPQTLFLVALQKRGETTPKVGRLRAKFNRQGRIQSLSWTNAANKKAGLADFEEMWICSRSAKSVDRKVTIYLDGDAWLTVNEWDLDFWTRVLGG